SVPSIVGYRNRLDRNESASSNRNDLVCEVSNRRRERIDETGNRMNLSTKHRKRESANPDVINRIGTDEFKTACRGGRARRVSWENARAGRRSGIDAERGVARRHCRGIRRPSPNFM